MESRALYSELLYLEDIEIISYIGRTEYVLIKSLVVEKQGLGLRPTALCAPISFRKDETKEILGRHSRYLNILIWLDISYLYKNKPLALDKLMPYLSHL